MDEKDWCLPCPRCCWPGEERMVDFGLPLVADITEPGEAELRFKESLRHVGPLCAGILMLQRVWVCWVEGAIADYEVASIRRETRSK